MNLSYNIKELTTENNTDINDLIEDVNEKWQQLEKSNDTMLDGDGDGDGDDKDKDMLSRTTALDLLYSEYYDNYNVKMLKMIMDYYQISKRKMTKADIVQSIILFECDHDNRDIVIRRQKLWEYMKELQKDRFFSKYVIFDF